MREITNPEDLRNRLEATEKELPKLKAEVETMKVDIAKAVKDIEDIKAAKP